MFKLLKARIVLLTTEVRRLPSEVSYACLNYLIDVLQTCIPCLFIYVTLLDIFIRVILDEANVTLKKAIFQASCPLQYTAELLAMNTNVNIKHDACVLAFADSAPDHNISFYNVTISWLGYFFLGKCDILIVARSSLTQSWTNPTERVMYVFNLALSNCALSRELMSGEFEKKIEEVRRHGKCTKASDFITRGRCGDASHYYTTTCFCCCK